MPQQRKIDLQGPRCKDVLGGGGRSSYVGCEEGGACTREHVTEVGEARALRSRLFLTRAFSGYTMFLEYVISDQTLYSWKETLLILKAK